MNSDPLDDLDRRIIAELQEDGRRSYREIAKRLGVAPGTVRTRVQQLIADRTVEVVAVPKYFQMGFQFYALVALRLAPGCADEVATILEAREEVSWVGLAISGYDVFVEVVLRDAQEFGRYRQDVLAALPGFQSADVFVYWDIRKLHYRVGGAANGRAADQQPKASGAARQGVPAGASRRTRR
ncbi:MAG TPA: Lrp/AsnC family transcriptional regulator [Candidatus Limnocylindrales bacterium]